jgi:7-cyano-7-deazaguanine synthase
MEVLLFSGGIESTCLAFMRKPAISLTIDYGQIVSRGEIAAAKNVANHFGFPHEILTIDLANFGSGQLAGRPAITQAAIPEFWPYRNQMLITLAAMRFAGLYDVQIAIGTVKGDSSHQDGTAEFIEKMNSVLAMQEGGTKLIAPAVKLDSIELMLASNIDVDALDMTFSCFSSEYPCGRCRGCIKNEYLRASYYRLRLRSTS